MSLHIDSSSPPTPSNRAIEFFRRIWQRVFSPGESLSTAEHYKDYLRLSHSWNSVQDGRYMTFRIPIGPHPEVRALRQEVNYLQHENAERTQEQLDLLNSRIAQKTQDLNQTQGDIDKINQFLSRYNSNGPLFIFNQDYKSAGVAQFLEQYKNYNFSFPVNMPHLALQHLREIRAQLEEKAKGMQTELVQDQQELSLLR